MIAQLTEKGYPLAAVQNDLTPAQVRFLELALNRVAELERQEIEREIGGKKEFQLSGGKLGKVSQGNVKAKLRRAALVRQERG